MYQNQEVAPYGVLKDKIIVESVTFRNNVGECNAFTGENVICKIVMSCKSGILYEDCEAQIIVTGDITYDSKEFAILEGDKVTKEFNFTMPNHDINFHVIVKEVDVGTPDDIAHSGYYNIKNVTRIEKNACTPTVPPIDFYNINIASVLIGASVGGAAGLVSDGKSGAIQFGLLGGVVALAYGYLTSTQQQNQR